jgi:tripartite ATP-independent transporter DctM subunit
MGSAILIMFLVLFLVGFPVVTAILIPSIFYIVTMGLPLDLMAQRMQYSLDSYTLCAVPLFILVGNLMNSSGITTRIFHFADVLTGRLPGGLAQVNIFASLVFSGMSGAALADVGGLGQIEIKAMKEKGFTVPYSAAVTVASATVGPIFPPSIPLVIYGSVAGVSIVNLLVGGIGPALVAVVAMMILTAVLAKIRNFPRAERWPTRQEMISALMPALPALLTPVLLVAGMLTGIFTPTEASALTVGYVLVISHFVYHDLTWKSLPVALYETIKSTCCVLIIVAAAAIFGWILAAEQIPQIFSVWFMSISKEPWILLLLLNLMLFVVGMFLDSTTAILLFVPIIIPPLVQAGIDPVHLGLIFVFNIMCGLITPPMGLSLFMVSKVGGVPIKEVVREVIPYYIPLGATLLLITYVPQIVLWIPNLLVK